MYALTLTQNCNLACAYCFEEEKVATKGLSEERAMKVIDFIIKDFLEKGPLEDRVLMVNLSGGEPLLEFEKLKALISYLQQRAKEEGIARLYLELSTNALLLDREKAEYMAKNRVHLYFGFDGIEECHDKNRFLKEGGGSFHQVFQNIRRCTELYKQNPVAGTTINLVASPNNIEYLSRNIEFVREHFPQTGVTLNFTYNLKWSDEQLATMRRELKKVASAIRDSILAGKPFIMDAFKKKISSRLAPEEYREETGSERCGAGRSTITFDTEGRIVPCGALLYIGMSDEEIVVGDCESGLDKDRVEKFREMIDRVNTTECRDCSLFYLCEHYCLPYNYQGTKNAFEVPYSLCEINKALIMEGDRIISELYKVNPDHLDHFRS